MFGQFAEKKRRTWQELLGVVKNYCKVYFLSIKPINYGQYLVPCLVVSHAKLHSFGEACLETCSVTLSFFVVAVKIPNLL